MDALIFDFDGTIVDTEPLHEAALRAALEPFAIPVRTGMSIGLSDEDAIAKACAEHGASPLSPSDVEKIFRAKVGAFTETLDPADVIVYPGAAELFLAAAREVPVAICTAAVRAEVVPLIDHLGLTDAMKVLVTADDVATQKPAPDGYLLACDRLGVAPPSAVAIEDSPSGVRSAVDAGIVTVALAHTTPHERLEAAHERIASTDGLTLDDLRRVHERHTRAHAGQ